VLTRPLLLPRALRGPVGADIAGTVPTAVRSSPVRVHQERGSSNSIRKVERREDSRVTAAIMKALCSVFGIPGAMPRDI